MEWCFSLRYIPGKSVWGDVDRAREMVEEEMLLNYWRMRRWCGSIWTGKEEDENAELTSSPRECRHGADTFV